jgi:hypothetical protein
VLADRKGGESLVLGDSIIRNVGSECSDMKVECFPGIRTEQLHRVIENRDLGIPDTFVIRVVQTIYNAMGISIMSWEMSTILKIRQKPSFQHLE